jgi:hypothetical protein
MSANSIALSCTYEDKVPAQNLLLDFGLIAIFQLTQAGQVRIALDGGPSEDDKNPMARAGQLKFDRTSLICLSSQLVQPMSDKCWRSHAQVTIGLKVIAQR